MDSTATEQHDGSTSSYQNSTLRRPQTKSTNYQNAPNESESASQLNHPAQGQTDGYMSEDDEALLKELDDEYYDIVHNQERRLLDILHRLQRDETCLEQAMTVLTDDGETVDQTATASASGKVQQRDEAIQRLRQALLEASSSSSSSSSSSEDELMTFI